jgi:integrase
MHLHFKKVERQVKNHLIVSRHNLCPGIAQFDRLGGLAGLRAMEVANIRGADLEEGNDGAILRVLGKGGTDLLIPVAPIVAQTIRNANTLDRLWEITPNKLSAKAAKRCAEF